MTLQNTDPGVDGIEGRSQERESRRGDQIDAAIAAVADEAPPDTSRLVRDEFIIEPRHVAAAFLIPADMTSDELVAFEERLHARWRQLQKLAEQGGLAAQRGLWLPGH